MNAHIDNPLSEEALTICINFDSLDTFVGLAPIMDLVRDLVIPVNLLPLVLPEPAKKQPSTKSGDPLDAYKARRAAARTRYAERELVRNCQRLGIAVEQGARRFNATPGALGLLWLHNQHLSQTVLWRFVETVFHTAYTADTGMDEVVVEQLLANASQHNVSVLGDPARNRQLQQQLDLLQQTLLAHGIFDSPAFWYQGELMQGRQHLPRLRWLLEGAAGPSPT